MTIIEQYFFWETISALAFLSALVLAIGFSVRYLTNIVKATSAAHRRHKSVINTVSYSTSPDQTLKGEVINRFVEYTENNELSTRSGYSPVLVDYVMEKLRTVFAVKSLSQMCNLNSKYCNQITQLTDGAGNVFLLGMSWAEKALYDSKGRLLHTCEQDLAAYSYTGDLDDERIIVSNMTELVFPIALGENHASVVEILNILKEGETTPVAYNDKMPNTVTVYKLQYHRAVGYTLQPDRQITTPLSNKMLDLSYGDVQYDFQGKTHTMSPSKAIPVLIESLKLGENGLVFGPPGVGKSTLLDQLQARMANSEDLRVIIMTPSQIRELQNSEAKTAFEAALSGKNVKNIIFIDEGETLLEKSATGLHTDDNSIILQMMSGGLQKALNCQMVIAFNTNPEDLNKALFRKGRAGMIINLGPLPAEKANQLIHEVKKLYPERIFDKEQYRSLLNMSNISTDKTTYAKPGYITLADLYSAFPHKSKYSAIVRALNVATNAQIEVPIQVTPTPAVEVREGRPERRKPVSLPVTTNLPGPSSEKSFWKKKKNR